MEKGFHTQFSLETLKI